MKSDSVGYFLVISMMAAIAAVHGSNILYPYDTAEGDSAMPPNDDGATDAITLSPGFTYYGNVHSSLYVNTNGIISFQSPVTDHDPSAFPLGSDMWIIAPFWADVDTEIAGTVYYRQTTSEAVLNKVNEDVGRSEACAIRAKFAATWAFIATYDDVTYYGGNNNTPRNTFQVVLATDGDRSYVIFNYFNVTWTTGTDSDGDALTGLGGTPAQAGFNAGDGIHYYALPGSRTPAIVDIDTTSNIGVPGRWVFRVDGGTVENMECTASNRVGQCMVRGDPHFEQYDRRHFLFSGFCKYTLSETLPSATEQFDITGTFVYYKPGSNRTMIQQVLIEVRGMTIQITTDGTVKVNNATISASTTPLDVGSGAVLFRDQTGFPRTVVYVTDVVKVELTTPVEGLRRKGHKAIITVLATYAGKLNGLCGDFDGDSADDESPCSGGPPADCFVDDGSCGA